MRHCVASYVCNIQAGNYYVYHLHEPENVTIGLRLSPTGKVGLEQLKCRYNKQPQKKSIAIINAWLIQHTNKLS